MLIQRIKVSNYKTYLDLDLDLTVDEERPIILIGGSNGGGKTTLFEAISGALYGLKIESREHFMELLNQGAVGKVKPEIVLEIKFAGKVLGQEQIYKLRRTYVLNPAGKPLESVNLNMNGNVFVYGTMTSPKERIRAEQEVNKIIKANLPQELSQYFLFDAMQSSELLKKNVFAQTIRDNFENVLGFKKYLQLKRAAERLQQEWAQLRLQAEQEAAEYNELVSQKEKLVAELNACIAEQDSLYKYLTSMETEYHKAKDGAQQSAALNKRITDIGVRIDDIIRHAATYAEDIKGFMENIELNVFLPKIAANLSVEINNILRIKLLLATIEEMRTEKKNLELTRAGGNEFIISSYEESQRKLDKAKVAEGQLKQDIQKLENRIHRYDVQIQQEPDLKYDTLVKLKPFFEKVADSLLKKKKAQIESEMQQQLNRLLVSYKGHIGRVELSDSMENFNIKIFHTKGNEISLNQLNAASKQIFIQVLLKVLRNLGDYNPPVMIDTVMGVLDNESREMLFEEYFPNLAEQTILLCTTSEVRPDSDYKKLEAFMSKTFTLHRDVEEQKTTVTDGYFGIELNQ